MKVRSMDFSLPKELLSEIEQFRGLLEGGLKSKLDAWYRQRNLPKEFFSEMGRVGA